MSDRSENQAGRCVNLQMLRASHRVMKVYDDAYRPHGIRATQLPVLSLLGQYGPLGIQAMADETESERSVLSRKLAVMEKNGWVQLDHNVTGREKHFVLTPAGHSLLAQVAPLRDAVQSQILSKFSAEEQQLMMTMHERLRDI